MKWPLVWRKTFITSMEDRKNHYEQLLEQEYDRAYTKVRTELKAVLRELLVDANYEIFHAENSILRSRITGFFSTALAYFHERSEK